MVTSQSPRAADEPAAALMALELSTLVPNARQPRKTISELQLDALKESIRAAGLVQPIVVRPLASPACDDEGAAGGAERYEIVAGERRWRAYLALAAEEQGERFATIPAIVRERDDTETQVAALVENVVRDDLNPIEKAEALEALREHLGGGWDDLARRVGLGVRTVHHLRRLLKLPKEFQQALADGRLKDRHSRALTKLLSKSKDGALELFEYLLANPRVNGKDAEAIARVLGHDDGYSAEEAHAYVKAPKPQRQAWQRAGMLPREPVLVEQTPSRVFMRGLRMLSGVVAEVKLEELGEEERAEVLEQVRRLTEWVGELGP